MSAAPKLELVKPDVIPADADGIVRLPQNVATALYRRMGEQEDTIVRLAEENARLKARNEMLDRANELVAQELEKARKRADALASVNGRLTLKLIQYHESQRTPEQDESLNDAIEQAREFAAREER